MLDAQKILEIFYTPAAGCLSASSFLWEGTKTKPKRLTKNVNPYNHNYSHVVSYVISYVIARPSG